MKCFGEQSIHSLNRGEISSPEAKDLSPCQSKSFLYREKPDVKVALSLFPGFMLLGILSLNQSLES